MKKLVDVSDTFGQYPHLGIPLQLQVRAAEKLLKKNATKNGGQQSAEAVPFKGTPVSTYPCAVAGNT